MFLFLFGIFCGVALTFIAAMNTVIQENYELKKELSELKTG